MSFSKVWFPYTPYKVQKEFVEAFYNNFAKRGILIAESPTGTGKTASILSALGHILKRQEIIFSGKLPRMPRSGGKIEFAECKIKGTPMDNVSFANSPIKIYYVSRTHKQLDQVLEELSKTPYKKYFRYAKYTPREVLCKGLCSLRSGCYTDDPRKCYRHLNFQVYKDAFGLEKLHDPSLNNKLCPYDLNELEIPKCNLVLMTYAAFKRVYLSRPCTDKVLIFDEAHNFEKMLAEDDIKILNLKCLELVHYLLYEDVQREMRDDLKNNKFMKLCAQLFKYTTALQNGAEVSFKRILKDLKYRAEDFITIDRSYREFSTLMTLTFTKFQVEGLLNAEQKLHLCSEFARMYEVLSTIFLSSEGYISILKNNELCILGFHYPEILMPIKKMIQMSSSVLFTSATLYPCELLCYELSKDTDKVITYSQFDPIIQSQNIFPVVVGQSIDGMEFKFNYLSKHDTYMMIQLGLTIKRLIQNIPDGSLIYFSSYKFMENVLSTWIKTGIYESLEKDKKIFVGLNLQSFKEYEVQVLSGKGGIFASVYAGLFSEGVNFHGPLSRAVFIVGMPYPCLCDQNFHFRLQKAEKMGPEVSAIFYFNECMRLINQSIGRSVRSIDDYSAIFLMDDRFSYESVQNGLSSWIRQNIRNILDYGTLKNKLDEFYGSNKATKYVKVSKK